MIKLFVTDLDGCISHPFIPPNWNAITKIKELNEASLSDPSIPALSICTGRPYPYAEAVAQWLNVRYHIIFESGAGMYHPKTNELIWCDIITPSIQAYFDELRVWTNKNVIPNYPNTLQEFTKRSDMGLVSPNTAYIMEMYNILLEKTHAERDWVEVHNTDISVNVIYKHCNKGTGINWLGELNGVSVSEMAFVGDGMNDTPALVQAKFGFSPSNGRIEAKKAADIVLKTESTEAVLEAYEYCIAQNRKA